MSPFLDLCDRLADAYLAWIAANAPYRMPPRQPAAPSARLTREADSMLFYKVVPSVSTAKDVTEQEITYTVGDADPASAIWHEDFEIGCVEGDEVVITQVDIDNAGNRSNPSPPFTFVAADTLAPPDPGAPGVVLAREED